MSVIKGFTGSVDFGAIIDSDMAYRTSSWTLDVAADTPDVTDFTSTGWREFVSALKTFSGSLELFVDSTKQIQPSDIGATATIKLYFNTTDYISGLGIVNGWNPSVTVDGVAQQSVSFQGTSDMFFTSS